MLFPQVLFPLALTAAAAALAPSAAAQGPRLGSVHRMLPFDRTETMAVLLADVDGDSDPDLVTGNRPWWSMPSQYDERNRLYLNDGSGRFVEAVGSLPQTKAKTLALVGGDLDGDGDIDLVVGNEEHSPYLELWLNDGAGVFSAGAQTFGYHSKAARSLALDDVEGDGDLDLLVCRDDIELWLNDGLGSFSEANGQLPWTYWDVQFLALGDVDLDGDPDLLFLDSYAGLWLNDGTGVFTDAAALIPHVGVGDGARLAIADVDADSYPDVLLLRGSMTPELWLNDGQGGFTATSGRLPPWPGIGYTSLVPSRAIACGDVDGDGDADVLVGVEQDRLLYINEGRGWFRLAVLPQVAALAETPAIAVADVDGDGDDDAVWATWSYWGDSSLQNHLLLGQSDGRLVDVTGPDWPRIGNVREVAATDVDRDGDEDLVVAMKWGHPRTLALLVNDGSGRLEQAEGAAGLHAREPALGLAVGDVDGDGDDDVVAGSRDASQLWLGDGKAAFELSPGAFPAQPDSMFADLELGDVDGDGDLDLLRAAGLTCTLWLGDGAGRFAAADSPLPPVPGYLYDAALEDLDGDGDLDACFALFHFVQDTPSHGMLWRNDGQGSFVDESAQLPSIAEPWEAFTLGDVDADGDPDLVVAVRPFSWSCSPCESLRLLANDGRGRFSLVEGAIALLEMRPSTVALLDADGDGDLDLAAAESFESRTGLLLNDGTGRFGVSAEVGPLMLGPIEHFSRLLPVDLDGDGDQELVVSGEHGVLVHTNLRRQLAWHSVPHVGRALTLDLHGHAGEAWTLSVSTDACAPAGGGIAPAQAWTVVASGVLDPQGRSSWTLDVPALPALVDRTWLWRATIGGSPSNLEATTFLGP